MIDLSLGLKVILSLWTAGSSAISTLRGKHPVIDLEVGEHGPKLSITNPHDHSLIIEHAEADPSVVNFALGDDVEAIADAIVRHRGIRGDEPMVVLAPQEQRRFNVINFDRNADPDTSLVIRVYWRPVLKRRTISRNYVKKKTTVRNVRDLQHAADNARRQR